METKQRFKKAFETRDIKEFMELVFPEEWSSICARILESGVTISNVNCHWAPRWSKVPPTIRGENTNELEMYVRSCIFRAHDCIHNLWGLPIPSKEFNNDDYNKFKKSQMCGEVVVLTIVEFMLCKILMERDPEISPIILKREAVNIMNNVFKNKTSNEIVSRIDTMLHKKFHESWMNNESVKLFREYYIPMLELDRKNSENNFYIMKANNWRPVNAPNNRYNSELTGLEMTNWMMNDFHHQLNTDNVIDEGLMLFNRNRLEGIIIPDGWNSIHSL